ncbi:MAG: thiol-activated cytolysin family protein [Calditrichota bacterium]
MFEFTTAYSSEQLSLDVGLNVAWAGGEVNSQFDFFTNEQKWVTMAVYKQGFYTVDFTTPTSPEVVFAENVDLVDVQNTLTGADAPAYVSSVTYGRIIMMRMETNTSIQTIGADVESALKYAAGVDVDGSLESEYQRILNNSSLEVVTIGGNASVASRLVTLNGTEGQLETVIQDTNAVYSINNPGVPIAYSVFHLKDNSLAKLGYTTDYTATECVQVRNKNTVKITMDEFYVIGDCDAGPGDFYLYGSTGRNGSRKGFSEIGTDSWSGAVEVSSGDAKTLNDEYIFTVDRVEGEEFYVYFYSPEWDNPAFGDPRHDPDMNPKSVTKTFRFSSGEWTNIPTDPNVPQYLTTGSGNCSARLQYKVEVY